MTMDVTNNRKTELKVGDSFLTRTSDEITNLTPNKSIKRPFDVAFLMLPDEKLKAKQTKLEKHSEYEVEISRTLNESVVTPNSDTDDDDDDEIEIDVQKIDYPKKLYTHKQQIFDDPCLGKAKQFDSNKSGCLPQDAKSAFTKVNFNQKESSRLSPNLSISPDLSYQNSLSPSPPINNRSPYANFQNIPPNMFTSKLPNSSAYQNNYLPDSSFLDPHQFLLKPGNEILHSQSFAKMRPMMAQYRPELSYPYAGTPFHTASQDMLKMAAAAASNPQDMRNPAAAAALLTTLLPPSLAALSLPAQNICAKCNISFRMTSDLVYHMRSHHKNENTEYTKRKREDKLKCPVCAESFRERHHLTRHMTAHQDKEKDGTEPNNKTGFIFNSK